MIVGTTALAFWTGKNYGDADLDIIGDPSLKDKITSRRVDVHGPESLNNHRFQFWYRSDSTMEIDGVRLPVCTLRGLAILKRSHMHRIHKWDRNMFLLKELDWAYWRDRLDGTDLSNLNERKKLTPQGYKSPSLMKKNGEFFDDYVVKHFDHDMIHAFVAYGDKPVYEMMKRDFSMAKCEKDMWERLPLEQRIQCVLEESYVIGLERFIVPKRLKNERHPPYRHAVLCGLKKICTTLSSGWFRDFATDYYYDIINQIDTSKMELFIKEKM